MALPRSHRPTAAPVRSSPRRYDRQRQSPHDEGEDHGRIQNSARGDGAECDVSRGADVNALWHGHFPIIFAPCESLDPTALKWLLDHGANPNSRDPRQSAAGHSYPGTALDYLIAFHTRAPPSD